MSKAIRASKSDAARRDLSGLGLIDYSLMTIGTALAVWSAGMAIAVPEVGYFSASLVIAGTIFSYLMRVLFRGKRWLVIDGVLYAAAGVTAALSSRSLQLLMPEGGFPPELFAAAWLSWMMILGSFVTWRDSTLLFQAVPAIAMFGLVGTYDTFREVRFAFFGFLICLATFFARAHARQMLKEAADSGFFTVGLAPGTPAPTPELTPGLMDRLREGPWRWVAGPEWAVASAMVVVVISLLGAPVIQSSMDGVAGFVRVNTPRIQQQSTIPQFLASGAGDQVGIGRGPVSLTEKPVLEVKINRPRYLRVGTYNFYQGRSWQKRVVQSGTQDQISASLDMMRDYRTFGFSIEPRQRLRTLPVPGVVIAMAPATNTRLQPDGTLDIVNLAGPYNGTSAEPDPSLSPVSAPDQPPAIFGPLLQVASTPRVAQLAQEVSKNETTDYDKALAIKREVERRIRYSIEAPAIPGGADPIDHVLFDRPIAYCDLFASSMVMMARAAGIPARYATGYLVRDDRMLIEGRYLVQEKDAHAWAELLFDDVGWVIFDATEGAVEIDGEGVGASNDRAWYNVPWVRRTIDAAIGVILLGGIYFGVRAYRYRIAHPDHHGELERVYLTFANELRRASGVRRGIGMTSDEYLEKVTAKLGREGPAAAELNRDFVIAFYSPGVIDANLVQRMEAQVREFRKRIRQTKRA